MEDLQDTIKRLYKKMTIGIALIITVCIILFLTIVFYKPYKPTRAEDINKALEKLRLEVVANRPQLETQLSNALAKINNGDHQDSALTAEIRMIRKEIIKNRDHEKIDAIDHYSDSDLIRAFSDFARQYKGGNR